MTPRTVVIPGNGTNSLSFTIPAGVDFNVESVVASVSAVGAADTIGELAIAEVTGAVIATKRQGLPIPGGSSGTETWALRLDDETAAAAGSAFPWAQAGINGFYNVTSGVTAQFGLDVGALFGTGADSGLFTVDPDGLGQFGLGINATGTYASFWGVQFFDVFGHRVANPENFAVQADDGSGAMQVMLPFIGNTDARGFTNHAGFAEWDCTWISTFAIHGSTGATPEVIAAKQATGETLHAYTQLMVFQLSTDTFGF